MTHSQLRQLLSLSLLGAASLVALPVQAQSSTVAIPVSGGTFTVNVADSTATIPGAISFPSGVPTVITPAGTATLTGFNNFAFQSGVVMNSGVPVDLGVNGNVTGSANLNDGRTATLTNAEAKLQATATLSGPGSFTTGGVPTSTATIAGTFKGGSINVPDSAIGNYTTPQVSIPVTNASFTMTVPNSAGPATLTLNSALSPAGTLSITAFTNPNFSGTNTIDSNTSASLTGIVSGTANLTEGDRVATITNRLTTLPVTASVQGGGSYTIGNVPTTNVTITGNVTGGNITVPLSSVLPAGLNNSGLPDVILLVLVNNPEISKLSRRDINKLVKILRKLDIDGQTVFLRLTQGDINKLIKIVSKLRDRDDGDDDLEDFADAFGKTRQEQILLLLTKLDDDLIEKFSKINTRERVLIVSGIGKLDRRKLDVLLINQTFLNALLTNASDALSASTVNFFIFSRKGVFTSYQIFASATSSTDTGATTPNGQSPAIVVFAPTIRVVPSALSRSRIHPGLGAQRRGNDD